MTPNNDSLTGLDDQDNMNSSLRNVEVEQNVAGNGNDLGNTTFTQEEIENANKPQPNVILDKISGDPIITTTGTRDTQRVGERANEAPDRNDSNTGGIIAGGAKGASQS